MKKLHMKGRILQLINDQGDAGLWDWEVSNVIEREYSISGSYWRGTTRVTMTDLYSSGIIESAEEALDEKGYFGLNKVSFKFRLSDFGRQRMRDTELL